MDTDDLDLAKKHLASREGSKNIGSWSQGEDSPPLIASLPQRAEARGIDAVIRTALGRAPDFTAQWTLTQPNA
jgi:hypothetical protein